ncbi:MAG: hypothetical protein HRT43_12175 [Campylobacteraceae bacterium]|nr:hypothetical protein [Campylobacteraceae bacterium]
MSINKLFVQQKLSCTQSIYECNKNTEGISCMNLQTPYEDTFINIKGEDEKPNDNRGGIYVKVEQLPNPIITSKKISTQELSLNQTKDTQDKSSCKMIPEITNLYTMKKIKISAKCDQQIHTEDITVNALSRFIQLLQSCKNTQIIQTGQNSEIKDHKQNKEKSDSIAEAIEHAKQIEKLDEIEKLKKSERLEKVKKLKEKEKLIQNEFKQNRLNEILLISKNFKDVKDAKTVQVVLEDNTAVKFYKNNLHTQNFTEEKTLSIHELLEEKSLYQQLQTDAPSHLIKH